MSDNSGHYLADVGGHKGSVVFDDGLSETVNKLSLSHAVKVKITLREHNGDGLPTNAEAERLDPLSRAIETHITDLGGVYLGRATYNEMRWELFLVNAPPDDLEKQISEIATHADYEASSIIEPDPDKHAYWGDLYPDADSRRVMNDMLVLSSLEKHGDDHTADRPVDHWIYFNKKASAMAYGRWLEEEGVLLADMSATRESIFKKVWRVRAQHIGTMDLTAITNMTLKLSRKARELGGEYDGWETQVTTSDA